MADRKGIIFTFTGPSGAGKDTLMNALIERDDNIQYFVTATTRAPRSYEVDGVHKYFLTKEEFHHKLDNHEFFEWSEHYGNFYGTLKAPILKHLEHGDDLFGDLTWTGAAIFKRKMAENTVNVLILPPSVSALDARLLKRQSTSNEDDETLRLRTEKVRVDVEHMDDDGYIFTNEDMKGSRRTDYDYVVVNDDLDHSISQLVEIIRKERQKRT